MSRRSKIAGLLLAVSLGWTGTHGDDVAGGHRPEHEKGAGEGIPVAVLLYDGALLLDYGIAAEMFLAANQMRSFTVFTVARNKEVRLSIVGSTRVDHTLADAPMPRVVIVPGGPDWLGEAAQPETVAFLKRAQDNGAILFSVCSGAMLLAKAGFLSGRPATTVHQAIPMLARMAPDATVTAETFVDSGNVVTAAGSGTAIEATLHLIERLAGKEVAIDLRDRYLDYPVRAAVP